MKKIAVFGKPGSGKSTLSKNLAAELKIQLYQLDSIAYKPDGTPVDKETYERAHDDILASSTWLIDGFGPIDSFNQRLDAADTLVYIDLPYAVSYWLVTKRLLQGLLVRPEGWPSGSSVVKGTLESYRVLRLCPKFWNDEFLKKLKEISTNKSLYVIWSISELNGFVEKSIKGKC